MFLTILAAIGGATVTADGGKPWIGGLIGAAVGVILTAMIVSASSKGPQCLWKAQGAGNLVSLPFVPCRK